jgi:chemotaxis family two-component system sensor kinase Cph1
MNKKKSDSDETAEPLTDSKSSTQLDSFLRSLAEKKVKENKTNIRVKLSPEEASRLLHELRVHQIELEMQNDELRRAQEVETTLRMRYFDLFDLAPVGYFVLSALGVILEANLTAATLLGQERAVLVKEQIANFISPPYQNIYYLHCKLLYETGETKACELQMVKKDGTKFWVHLDTISVQNTDGSLVYRVVISDVTERKLAEEEIKSLAKFPMENPNPVLRIKKDGEVLFSNKAGLLVLDFWKTNVGQVVPERWRNILGKMSASKNLNVNEEEEKINDKTFLFIITPIIDDNYMNVYGRDITEHKQMEQKLAEAYHNVEKRTKELEIINENLDSFAYSVSHDLRAPLRAISGFAQVLKDTQGDKGNEEMRHYLNRISEGSQQMGRLIDDLLGFSRATRSEIKYEKINVQNIVNDLIKVYCDVEPDRDIKFIVNPLAEVEADKEMLKIIFSNLLQNSVKFTRDRKKAQIEIGCDSKEDYFQFYIKDNGIGFDEKFKDKLFVPFQRLHTDERYPGTGIGLTTVKRIINKHGGKVWAKGEIDKGAEFYFTLPFMHNNN